MGLFERLKAAERARNSETLDLTEAEAATESPPSPRAVWGKPTRCPACGNPGYLDHIDLIRRVMFQHCPDCRHRWETTEAETSPV